MYARARGEVLGRTRIRSIRGRAVPVRLKDSPKPPSPPDFRTLAPGPVGRPGRHEDRRSPPPTKRDPGTQNQPRLSRGKLLHAPNRSRPQTSLHSPPLPPPQPRPFPGPSLGDAATPAIACDPAPAASSASE